MVVIHFYLERENYKVPKFHRNNSCYFKKAPPSFKHRTPISAAPY